MKIHPREAIVNRARMDFFEFLIQFRKNHSDLTAAEMISLFSDEISGITKYAIRDERMNEHTHAPWTDEQVAALNRYQQEGQGHPFTGNRHQDGSECILVATNAGWVKCCSDETIVQTWAWDFMAK